MESPSDSSLSASPAKRGIVPRNTARRGRGFPRVRLRGGRSVRTPDTDRMRLLEESEGESVKDTSEERLTNQDVASETSQSPAKGAIASRRGVAATNRRGRGKGRTSYKSVEIIGDRDSESDVGSDVILEDLKSIKKVEEKEVIVEKDEECVDNNESTSDDDVPLKQLVIKVSAI